MISEILRLRDDDRRSGAAPGEDASMLKCLAGMRTVRCGRGCAALLTILLCGCAGAAPAIPPAGSAGRIAPALALAAQRLAAGAPLSDYAQGPVRADAHGRLQVYVSVDAVTPEHTQALRAAGLADAEPSAALGVVQGWLPPDRLGAIAALPFVTRIAPPRYARAR
ncbi:MAG: hypothetical protein KGI40_04035 [Xanthomonadaceae bacterium]|nr:hypothetical protein [Xanthomonadaceae bacterium]MDE2178272.1 hypothetical protein [Xanthomonadaceae bacterium]MDE2245783.1 hypothetical protein [Xanthomonadaceae bacterium]